MKRVHESKRQVCESNHRTDLPWMEFLRLLLMVVALLFFGMSLSLLMGDEHLVMKTLHVLERVRHTALRVPLETMMVNWNVMTEMHLVTGTTRTYPVSSEMCFSKEKSSDTAILCNPLPWQQTYLCDYTSEMQRAAETDYLAGMGWAHDENSVNYFMHDYHDDSDLELSKHSLKQLCSQKRIFDAVLVHNDISSVSVVDSVAPSLILATLFLLGEIVAAFLAANLHVNDSRSHEYPMFFMPSCVSSYWGVAIGLLIIFGVVLFVWMPSDSDHHGHHHSHYHDHAVHTSARRHGASHDSLHQSLYPNHHHHTDSSCTTTMRVHIPDAEAGEPSSISPTYVTSS